MRLGGAEKQLAELICRLPRDRFEQKLVTIQGAGHAGLVERIRAAGCEVIPLEYKQAYRVVDPRFYFSMGGALARYVGVLRAFRPQVVHAQLDWANILSYFAGRIARVPAVVTSRLSLARDKEARTLRQKLENFCNRRADAVFINSDAVRRDVLEFERLIPEKLHLIYNGVILEDFPKLDRAEARRAVGAEIGVEPGDLVVIAVANLHPYKGHEELIRAAASLAGEFPNLRVLCPGRDAGMRGKLESLAKELGIGDRVRLLGERADIPRLLAASDIFVHPSHEEGFSNAILEAMTAALPSIVTNVGGNPEAIREGIEGFIVPPRDPAPMAVALRKLLADVALRTQIGASARARIESEFSMDKMIASFSAWYERFTSGPG